MLDELKYNLFERLFLIMGVLIGTIYFVGSILGVRFLEEISGNHKLHESFVNLGIIKIDITLFYFLIFIAIVAIFYFIGKIIDKSILNFFAEHVYQKMSPSN